MSLVNEREKRRKLQKETSMKKIRSFAEQKERDKAAAFFGDLIDE